MAHREFTSAKTEADKEPITFSIDGEIYRCVAKPSWHLIKTISKAASGGSDAVVHVDEFLHEVVVDEDQEQLEKVLRRKSNPVDVEMIQQIIEYLAEVYSGRPTPPPSGSRNGRHATTDSSRENSYSEELTQTTSP